MSRRALQTSRYSPGNLAPDVLERLFIGRSNLLDELIAKVAKSILSKDKHHILLVGPRGSGKTHVTALLHQRLKSDPNLAEAREKSVIAYLNEEEWGVASFLDFILVILRSIQSEHGAVARGIALVEETFERDPDKARDLAEDTLRQVVKNKTLVLLCENLNDLFQGIGSEGQQRWRSLIQEQRSWCIVATAPSLFLQISRQTEPFYGFFTIRSLEKLSFEDAIALLHRKAELEGRAELAAAIDTATGRARVRAIHHIAGGNHRAYIVLSEFLTQESLDELVSPFMNMVDDLTPYYQERMRNLTSPLQRKLVDYLCRQRKPATVRDIARATLVQQQSAAKQLGELAKSGLVQKTSRGRESFYELSEPLMRICIEVKDNRTEYIKVFVDLLRHWFSARELESRHLGSSSQSSPVDYIHLRAALEDLRASKTDPFLDALKLEVLRCQKEGDLKGLIEAAGRRADELGEQSDYSYEIGALVELEDHGAVERRTLDAVKRYPDESYFKLILAGSLFCQGKFQLAIEQCDEVLARNPRDGQAWYLRGSALLGLARHEEFIANEREALRADLERYYGVSHDLRVRALAYALYFVGRMDEAFEVSADVLAKFPEDVDAWRLHLNIASSRANLRDVEEALQQVMRLSSDGARGLALLEVQLRGRLGHWRDAVTASERALDQQRTPDAVFANAWATLGAGRGLSTQQEESLVMCSGTVSDDWLCIVLHVLRMLDQDRVRGAIVSRAGARSEQSSDLLYEQALVWMDQGKLDDAAAAMERLASLGASTQSRILALLIKSARQGMSIVLEELVRDAVEADQQQTREVLAAGLWGELQQRGPSSFATQCVALRDRLAGDRQSLVHEALLAILRRLVRTRSSTSRHPEWADALAMMNSRMPGFEVLLQLFSVGVRYTATEDESVLLDIPLEQRRLLTSEVGKLA